MCLSCKKKKVSSVILNRLTNVPIKFDSQEIEELRKKYTFFQYRFSKVSANNKEINREMFLKNMGILGLQSAQGFADRLFNSFDIDNDNKVGFFINLDFVSGFCGVHGNSEMRVRKV